MPDADRQTLIYIPGIDGTGRLLFRQQELYGAYDVICESYPHDRASTYEELAGAAAGHLERAARGRPAVVLAESFGGAVALTLALMRPDLIERMVLVNTFARFRRRIVVRLGSLLAALPIFKTLPTVTRRIRSRFFIGEGVAPEDRDAIWELTKDVPMSAYAHRLAMIARLDLRERLHEITMPSLVLVAPNDRVVPPRAGREVARLLPNARLIERPVGHAALIHPGVNIRELLDDSTWRELETG